MELPIVLGRGFTNGTTRRTPRVAVVNQAFVRTYFDGEQSPIGRQMTSVRWLRRPGRDRRRRRRMRSTRELRGAAPPTVYLPARPARRRRGQLRRACSPERAGPKRLSSPPIRSAVREVDPALPVLNLRTQDEQIDRLERTGAAVREALGPVRRSRAAAGMGRPLRADVARRAAANR